MVAWDLDRADRRTFRGRVRPAGPPLCRRRGGALTRRGFAGRTPPWSRWTCRATASRPPAPGYDPAELVDDLAELVAGLGGTRAPVVVGHGASAALALRFAARYASHAVVTVDAPDDCRRRVPREEYLARMRLDTLPERYRDLVRPAADPGLLAAYGSCVDLEAPPAASGTARLDVRSTDYGVPGRFAHLTAASRLVGALGALL